MLASCRRTRLSAPFSRHIRILIVWLTTAWLIGCGSNSTTGTHIAAQDAGHDAVADAVITDSLDTESDAGAALLADGSGVSAGGDAQATPSDATAVPSDVSPACPIAKIGGGAKTANIPQSQSGFKGDESKAADGTPVAKYKWTLTQQPGSTAAFIPSDSFPNPTLSLAVVGEYKICLDVWDKAGVKSCVPACLTLLILPEVDIYVKLTWSTPGDPDPTSTGPDSGTDLDLHFAHDLAKGPDTDCDGAPDPWFVGKYDVWSMNPSPSWGDPNPAAGDDPSLESDDADGAGPENLNLDEPEGKAGAEMAYHVGVHYFNAHFYGPSYATVQIYITGMLTAQFAGVKMNELDMWYVGKIHWPNTIGGQGGTVAPFEPCFQSGDPCSKSQPGTTWQPKGASCISPYYAPAASGKSVASIPAICKTP